MAREWVIKDYLGYQGLTLQDCEIENAGPGEVRLRIEAFALNWGDMDLMLDRYSLVLKNFLPNMEWTAGIVDQIGEGVSNMRSMSTILPLPYFL